MTIFTIILPVWGQPYADSFIHYSLPSLKAQTKPIDGSDIELVIATDYETADYFKQNYLAQLRNLKTIFLTTNISYDISPHKMQTHLYRLGLLFISQQRGETGFAIFITPDIILPVNALEAIENKVMAGLMCCYMLGLRLLDSPESRSHLDSMVQDNMLSLTAWQLIELAYTFVHPQTAWLTTNNYWINRPRDFYPHIYMKTDNRFQAKGFHLHPLYLRVPKHLPTIKDTIDGDFIGRLGFPSHQIGFFDNDDPVVSVDLAPNDRFGSQVLHKEPIHPHSVYEFGIKQSSFQRSLFSHLFLITADSHLESRSSHTMDIAPDISGLDRFAIRFSGSRLFMARLYIFSRDLSSSMLRRVLPSRLSRFVLVSLKSMWIHTARPHFSVSYIDRD